MNCHIDAGNPTSAEEDEPSSPSSYDDDDIAAVVGSSLEDTLEDEENVAVLFQGDEGVGVG
jgi:hypothetical protein